MACIPESTGSFWLQSISIEDCTKGGLVTFFLLFVLELTARRVPLAGCTSHPTQAWMIQTRRADPLDGFPAP